MNFEDIEPATITLHLYNSTEDEGPVPVHENDVVHGIGVTIAGVAIPGFVRLTRIGEQWYSV